MSTHVSQGVAEFHVDSLMDRKPHLKGVEGLCDLRRSRRRPKAGGHGANCTDPPRHPATIIDTQPCAAWKM